MVGVVFALLATAFVIRMVGRKAPEVETKKATQEISHRQTVWIYALEWCESRGVESAINQKDKDNTPSYYSFQFKPGTFQYYGEKYGVVEKQKMEETMETMKNRDLQEKIVEGMMFDKEVVWRHEFPDCVKKLGLPPKN